MIIFNINQSITIKFDVSSFFSCFGARSNNSNVSDFFFSFLDEVFFFLLCPSEIACGIVGGKVMIKLNMLP